TDSKTYTTLKSLNIPILSPEKYEIMIAPEFDILDNYLSLELKLLETGEYLVREKILDILSENILKILKVLRILGFASYKIYLKGNIIKILRISFNKIPGQKINIPIEFSLDINQDFKISFSNLYLMYIKQKGLSPLWKILI